MDKDLYIKRIETPEIIVHLRKDGIVHVAIHAKTHITVEVQQRMSEAYNDITTIDRPFIFEGGEFISITKEARANAIEMENRVPVKSSALIVKNLGQKIIADFYYKVNKPTRPLKIFKSFEDGILWSLEQL